MQQKSKFIILISLICLASLLFIHGEVFSGTLCTYEVKNCKNVYDKVTGKTEYVCDGYEKVCVETTTTTTKEKEDKEWNCRVCSGPYCVIQTFKKVCQDACKKDLDCFQPPPPPTYSCKQCRDTTCSVRYSNSPCSNLCSTNADCGPITPPTSPPATSPPATSPPSNGNGWTPPATSPPSNGWTPPSNGGTPSPPPPPPPKYSCNKSNWTCYQDSSGIYSSLSRCQDACVEPPCMIDYFEFPKRAWVGYSITGKWSASTWCEDCDVTCIPYPECVWKENNIGIGFDEYKFTIKQSGTYTYTLTCYKQGGRDQRQATVTIEALNLPWWREIIPVLRGFLGGVWR